MFLLELNLAFKIFVITVILFGYVRTIVVQNYYHIHKGWMNTCWRNHIHNTDAKYVTTQMIRRTLMKWPHRLNLIGKKT
jgi:hypothetical protein